jgi:hypothetical protein
MTQDNAQSIRKSSKGKIAARDMLQRFLCSSKYWEKARKDFLFQAELVAGDNATQPNNIPRSKIAQKPPCNADIHLCQTSIAFRNKPRHFGPKRKHLKG